MAHCTYQGGEAECTREDKTSLSVRESAQSFKLSVTPDGHNTVLIVEVCSWIQGNDHRFFYNMRLPAANLSRQEQEPRQQLREVRRAQARDGVPARLRQEPLRAAVRVRAVRDVVERAREEGRVDLQAEDAVRWCIGKLEQEERGAYSRVDPPDGALADGEACVVDGGEDRGESGRGRGRSGDEPELAIDRDREVQPTRTSCVSVQVYAWDGGGAYANVPVGRNIGVRASGRVEDTRCVAGRELLEVVRHRALLEVRAREDVGEPAARWEALEDGTLRIRYLPGFV